MKIPAKSDDAVRAAVALARVWPGQMTADAIATNEELPWRFVQQILSDLRRAGLVQSRRGPHGGYALTRAPDRIDIASVLAAVKSPLVNSACVKNASEPVGSLWSEVSAAAQQILRNRSLGALVANDTRISAS
jgi:Rrf2 family protein